MSTTCTVGRGVRIRLLGTCMRTCEETLFLRFRGGSIGRLNIQLNNVDLLSWVINQRRAPSCCSRGDGIRRPAMVTRTCVVVGYDFVELMCNIHSRDEDILVYPDTTQWCLYFTMRRSCLAWPYCCVRLGGALQKRNAASTRRECALQAGCCMIEQGELLKAVTTSFPRLTAGGSYAERRARAALLLQLQLR